MDLSEKALFIFYFAVLFPGFILFFSVSAKAIKKLCDYIFFTKFDCFLLQASILMDSTMYYASQGHVLRANVF